MTQYLFLFTIGPVQSFIAQARKTQDLYAGSFLLSYLIDSAMDKLKKDFGNKCEFIFPIEKIKSKPNRFIAKVESDDIETIGKDLKDSVEKEFEKMAKTALDSLNLTYENKFSESFWKQIRDFLQANWAALSLNDDYAHSYKELERSIGAIKNVRDFQQLKETGRKCSLCGERNVLFYRKTSKNRKPKYIQENAIELDKNELNFGEGLCAVCFTKRFYETSNFPSTAEIAAMDWIQNIPEDTKQSYKKLFNNFDEQLFYEDNLRRKYLEKYGQFKDDKSLSEANKQLKSFYKMHNKSGNEIGKPSKYYTILMLDGDSMGKWLSGEFLEDKARLLESHKELSKALGSYADKAGKMIRPPKGKIVYVGGDDVLAFVNLNHLLPIMGDLRAKFPKFEELGFEITGSKKSSSSCGVVIAHYKTPLSEVLKWARKMEKEAKSIDEDKDAFVIAVLKRSGEIRKAMFKWQYSTSFAIEILERLIQSLKQEDFSNTFIKNFGVEFKRLMDEKGKYKNNLLIKTEMNRLIERSYMMTRKLNEAKEEFLQRKKRAIDDLTEKLGTLYTNSKLLDNFLSALDIADFIERETPNDNKN